MVAVPLPTGIKGIKDTPKLKECLVNILYAGDYLIRTPGIELVSTVATSICRGAGTWYVDGNQYRVIGGTLYQIDSNENVTTIGSIAGSEDCVFSGGQVELVVIVKGGAGYTYSSTAGLVQIASTNFLPSVSVDFIDGRHVYIPADGSPAFYSEVDQAGTINSLNFFDAEELPDLNKVVINVSNNLYIGGQESFEIQRTTTEVQTPFRRRDGARVDVGYVSGIERYKSSFMFIGRERDQGFAIHVMASGGTKVVSNDAIGELLNDEYTQPELEGVNSFSYIWKNKLIIGWNLTRHTIIYCDGSWAYLDSNLDIDKTRIWNGRFVTFAHGRYYIGDKATGKIGKLVNDPSEYGSDVQYQMDTFVRSPRDSYFSPQAFEIDCLTGQDGTTIGLSLSRDGRFYSKFQYRNLRATGDYSKRIRWSGGLGTFESFMGVRLRGTGSVRLSIEGAEMT